jgi:O-antigen/teichoic acid export membrane protein
LTEEQKSYRQIFKATTLFGGVQVFNIIVAIIRSKFVAILLGPAGMGISGLLTSTTAFISSFTNFGLGVSAVKSIAAPSYVGNSEKAATVISVLRRLIWVTGLLGTIITAGLSPWLSQLTFGNKDYKFAFIWISVTLLFQQLSNGYSAVLQGLRQLKYLAKANMIGSLIGLIITVPLYYFWKFDGIVPVIILSSLTSMGILWYFSRRTGVKSVMINKETVMIEGREMIKMGFLLSLSGIITVGVSYIVRVYISHTGGVEQVGLYNAGFAIINTYVGMIFTAMGTDYYPRLSAVAHDNQKAKQLINQQAEVAIMILAPVLAIFLVFISWVVIIFFSNKFTAVNEMIHWAALGMYFKAAAWSIGFILLAKGASRLFFWNELLGNIYILGFNIEGYRLAGLEGLGISFLAAYFIFFIQVFIIANHKYKFVFDKEFYEVAGLQLLIGLICFGVMKTLKAPWTYITGTPLILVSFIFSFKELDKRIDLRTLIRTQIINLRNKN